MCVECMWCVCVRVCACACGDVRVRVCMCVECMWGVCARVGLWNAFAHLKPELRDDKKSDTYIHT